MMHRKLLAMAAASSMGAAALASPLELDLSGEWSLASAGREPEVRCTCRVPGDVRSALAAAAPSGEAFEGTNALWIGRTNWRLSRTFVASRELVSKKEVVLRIEDCDTFASVSVNGHEVGVATDRFQRYTFNVKPWLKPGENLIETLFTGSDKVADLRREELERDYPMLGAGLAPNQALVRRPAFLAGLGGRAPYASAGILGSARIIAADSPWVDYVYSTQDFDEGFSNCTLTVVAELCDGSRVERRFEVPEPPLWRPRGEGAARFHEYSFDAGGEKVSGRVGLRKIELAEGPSPAFLVNGRRVEARVARWCPRADFGVGWTKERWREEVEKAVAGGKNTLLVWGGGQFEPDAFYDACDEAGVMVWHDLMFADAAYPSDMRILREVSAELEHQLRRLRDHASIAVWCGESGCLEAIETLCTSGEDADFHRAGRDLRLRMEEELAGELDPQRPFLPCAPSGFRPD